MNCCLNVRVRSMPFEECAVDLIGPWVVQVHGKPYEFNALTAIDTVSNLVKQVGLMIRHLCTLQKGMHKYG